MREDRENHIHFNESLIPWSATYRIIPSKFPPINFFENLTDPDLLEALYFIESLTNDRLRDEIGDITLVKKEDRVVGSGASVVMASFTHISTSRFSDGTFGVYYAARDLETAIKETVYHQEQFMRYTSESAGELTMRVYKSKQILKPLVDIRSSDCAKYHLPNDYSPSQQLGLQLKEKDNWGLVYQSVRHQGGECVAIFRPPAIGLPVIQTKHLRYFWNGKCIESVLELREMLSL
ncbi:MAG: RES family NAD+ phosphorylase [Gammaproteobacteria bacterium]